RSRLYLIHFHTRRNSDINDFSNATELADYLVNKGVPFRNAHEIVGKIVLWSIQHNVYLLDVPLEEYQNVHPCIEADIFDFFIPSSEYQTSELQLRFDIVY